MIAPIVQTIESKFRELTTRECVAVRQSIERHFNYMTGFAIADFTERLNSGKVAYAQQGNFTICLLQGKDGLRVGVTKRSMGGLKRRNLPTLEELSGIKWVYYEVEPDEEDVERAQRIALSRAVKAKPIEDTNG